MQKTGKHLPATRAGTATLVCILLASGCGRRSSRDEPAPAEDRDARTAPQPTFSPDRGLLTPGRRPPRAHAAAAVAGLAEGGEQARQPPLAVTAILMDGGGVRAGLLHEDTGQSGFVREGQSFAGFAVERIDPVRGQVTMGRAGETYHLALGRDMRAAVPPAATPDADDAREWPAEDIPALGIMETIEPTEDEISRGIDPNLPETWPPDYRGPGIERALLILAVEEDE